MVNFAADRVACVVSLFFNNNFVNCQGGRCSFSLYFSTACIRFYFLTQAHGVYTEGDVVYVPFPLDCKYGEWRELWKARVKRGNKAAIDRCIFFSQQHTGILQARAANLSWVVLCFILMLLNTIPLLASCVATKLSHLVRRGSLVFYSKLISILKARVKRGNKAAIDRCIFFSQHHTGILQARSANLSWVILCFILMLLNTISSLASCVATKFSRLVRRRSLVFYS